MRTKTILASIGLIFLISGCGATTATHVHPDYSIFKNVPASKVNAIKEVVKKEGIPNLEYPTKVPYKITMANMPSPAIGLMKHHISYFLGYKQGSTGRDLGIDANSEKQSSISPNDVTLANNQVVTKLSDGTKALFGNNGAVTQLAWIKNDVLYIMSSSKGTIAKSEPDLTETQLIQVADSFN